MNQNKPCEVEGCTGTYQEKTVDYCNLMKVGTDEYRISVDDYHKLETKKGYHRVVATHCSICDDDLDVRLIEFCKQLHESGCLNYYYSKYTEKVTPGFINAIKGIKLKDKLD